MKTTFIISTFVLIVALCCSCGRMQNVTKHFHSWATGLDRKITLYDLSGKVIKEWKTKAQIEDNGGSVYFIDSNGKAVTVSGTFIIQEE